LKPVRRQVLDVRTSAHRPTLPGRTKRHRLSRASVPEGTG